MTETRCRESTATIQAPSEVGRLRVAMVSFAGAASREAQSVRDLAGALAGQGHHVVLYHRGRADVAPIPAGVESAPLSAGPPTELTEPEAIPYVGRFAAELDGALRHDRPDVVHSHCWLAGLATHLATRGAPVPVAHTFYHLQLMRDLRTPPGHRGAPNRSQAEWAVAQHTDRVIASTAAERECLIQNGVPKERIAVVPTGVDAETLSPDGPADPRRARFRIVLLGPDRAGVGVRALTALPDTELALATGDAAPGRERRRLRRLAQRLRVADRVEVVEATDRARRSALIRSADAVLLLGGADELDPLSLEAMACGVPVVAAHGVATEAVVDGVTGLHVPGHDCKTLAKSLRDLLANEALRLGMGWAGRDRAVNRYSWSRVATETARVYLGMVRQGGAATVGSVV